MPRPKNTDGYPCELCGKQNKTRQAKYSHKTRCGRSVSLLAEYKQLLVEFKQQKEIIEVYKAAGTAINAPAINTGTGTINNTVNNATADTINNVTADTINIKVNVFGNEDLSHLDDDYIIQAIQSESLSAKLQTMIRETFTSVGFPQNMTAYIPNRDIGYVRSMVDGVCKWVRHDIDSLPMEIILKVITAFDRVFKKYQSMFSKNDKAGYKYFIKQIYDLNEDIINATICTMIDGRGRIVEVYDSDIPKYEPESDEEEDDSSSQSSDDEVALIQKQIVA
jgi:hypothetical protein